jgi:hypothetical protein
MHGSAEVRTMRPPAVSCTDCSATWNSNAMAEGLRLLGSCPKCGGELAFRDGGDDAREIESVRDVAPHLVLGIPRR